MSQATFDITVESVPFPSSDALKSGAGSSTRRNSLEGDMNISVPSSVKTQSQATTSSDKLSALPTSTAPSPNASRILRSSNFAMSHIFGSGKRKYRHSLDSSTAVPRPPTVDFDMDVKSSFHGNRSDSQERNANRLNEAYSSRTQPNTPPSGKETPRQRVSFDSDHHSLPTLPSVGQAFSRAISRGNDPTSPSPLSRPSSNPDQHGLDSSSTGDLHHLSSRSPSHSKSRGHSPLRMIHNWSSSFHRGRTASEDRFVPVDPFKFKGGLSFRRTGSRGRDVEAGHNRSFSGAYDCDDLIPTHSMKDLLEDAHIFLGDTLPREIYLNFLLRLPAMYFSRVARIFEDADVSRPDIQRMIDNSGFVGSRRQTTSSQPFGASDPLQHSTLAAQNNGVPPMRAAGEMLSPGAFAGIGLSAQVSVAPAATMMHMPLPFPDEWTTTVVSPALIRFKHSWEAFIASLLKEWKTLNLVSALLSSAILTIFQIPEAADDPVTRTLALLSLICALMSLSYGCIYIVRFGTMRSMFHASRWAEEARKTNTSILWNVWVLLATPAVWMAWAMILFLSSILSFVWRTGTIKDPTERPPSALGPRIGITTLLFIGIIYFGMIVRTLRSYGSHTTEWHGRMPVGNHSPRVVKRQHQHHHGGMKEKLGDHDPGLERRGRARERSASVNVRRREEEPEDRASSRRQSRD